MKTSIAKKQGGMPKAGTIGQVPQKNSSTDFDEDWATALGGGGGIGGFGAWSTPITEGVPYQALTDGIVLVSVRGSGSPASASINIKTDSLPIPTTVRVNMQDAVGNSGCATCPVRAGDYVLVVSNAGFVLAERIIYWIPIDANGSNTIFNLNAGEDIDGASEPKAVFLGDVPKTPTLQITTGGINFSSTDYDYSAVAQAGGGVNVAFTGTRRASSFVTPAYATTVNALAFPDLEGNLNNTVVAPIEFSIYTDVAGAPGVLVAQFTDTSYPIINNNFKMLVNFGDNVVLAASTTYWIVADTGTDGGNIVNFNNADPALGLLWNGSAWVAGHRFDASIGLRPFAGDVYQSYYAATAQPRALFLGMVDQNPSEGDNVDVIHDGVVTGFTGLSEPTAMFTPDSVAGTIAVSSGNNVKIGTATKATEIVLNRVATYQ